jgi:hypothetical protein
MQFPARFNGFGALLLFSLVLLVQAGPVQAGGSKPVSYMRFHLQLPPNVPPEGGVPVALTDPEQLISVNKLPEATDKDFAAINKLPDGRLVITWTTSGQVKMETSTSGNLGKILVVICNGRVIYAPMIDVPLRGTQFVLPPGRVSDQELALLQEQIRKRARS